MNRQPAMLLTALGIALAALPDAGSAQTVPDVTAPVESAIERQAERVSQQAEQRAQQQAEQAVQQTERVQQQAEERAQQQAERAQEQAERAQQQAERASSQAERAQQQVERTQQQAERAQQQTGQVQNRAEQAQQQLERLGIGDDALPPQSQAAQDRLPGAPDRPAERPSQDGDNDEPVFADLQVEPPIRSVSAEWVMLLDAGQRRQLEREAPEMMRFLERSRRFEALDSDILTFRVPPDLDSEEALRELVPEALQDLLDRNHIYGVRSGPKGAAGKLDLPMPAACSNALLIGMIDSAVDRSHAAFSRLQGQPGRMQEHNVQEDPSAVSKAHGTAVASLLLGEGPALQPLLPNARLYNAAVMQSREPGHPGSTVVELLAALDWLLTRPPQVINMSLAGPDNRLLARGITAARENGRMIVAAAGNGGPHAGAQYPAAYEGVIAVTAVDGQGGIYHWANQGAHLDFAALGVNLPVAGEDGAFGEESGTSMATAVVSALLACALEEEGSSPARALQQLKARATDLGAPGHDPVFGHGLLHP